MSRPQELGEGGAAEEVEVPGHGAVALSRLRERGEGQAVPVPLQAEESLLVDPPQLAVAPLPLDDPLVSRQHAQERHQPEPRPGPPPPSRPAAADEDYTQADDEGEEQGAAEEGEAEGDPRESMLLGGEGVAALLVGRIHLG